MFSSSHGVQYSTDGTQHVQLAVIGEVEDVAHGLIRRWQAGDQSALDELLPLVYSDLRAMAARKLQEGEGHVTLQPTALVHDVFVRLLGAKKIAVNDGEHLLRLAGRTMRNILIDRLREKRSARHGGDWLRIELADALDLPIPAQTDLLLLDAAMNDLAQVSERLALIVELRYFVGLSVNAVAAVVGVDKRTVYRDWVLAKAWLRKHIGDR